MTTAPSIRPIVVGVDGSGSGARALDWAIDEASRRGRPLHLVHARETTDSMASSFVSAPPSWDDPEWVVRDAREHVASRAPQLVVTSSDELSPASSALVAASEHADTVVVGARGRGALGTALLGSTSHRVATHAGCPVVVVREAVVPSDASPRVVVGVDGSALSAEAVGYAFATASERSLPLTVVHAWSGQELAALDVPAAVANEVWAAAADHQRIQTEESIVGWSEKYPDVTVRITVPHGPPVDALVTESELTELLVLGSRGLGPFRGVLLGSVSEAVLHRAHCPVAVVRPNSQLRPQVQRREAREVGTYGPDRAETRGAQWDSSSHDTASERRSFS